MTALVMAVACMFAIACIALWAELRDTKRQMIWWRRQYHELQRARRR